MNDADFTLIEYSGELSGSGQQGAVSIGQDDWFDSLPTRLGSQFAVVEENEQWAHTLRHESAHNPEYMALDTAEELTDGAYRDTPWICARCGFSKKIKPVLARTSFAMSNGIIGGVRARWPYAALHDSHSLWSPDQTHRNIRPAFLSAYFFHYTSYYIL